MNIAVGVICTILMVLGAAELVRLLVFWWTSPLLGKEMLVVVCPESAEECEHAVRTAAERMRWLEIKGPCRLMCINANDDPEIDKICRFLSLRYPYLRVFKSSDLVYDILETEMTERTE